jgi:hypothetical protein
VLPYSIVWNEPLRDLYSCAARRVFTSEVNIGGLLKVTVYERQQLRLDRRPCIQFRG